MSNLDEFGKAIAELGYEIAYREGRNRGIIYGIVGGIVLTLGLQQGVQCYADSTVEGKTIKNEELKQEVQTNREKISDKL